MQKNDSLLNSQDYRINTDIFNLKSQVLPQIPRNRTQEFKRSNESENPMSLLTIRNKYLSPTNKQQSEKNKQRYNIQQSIQNIENNYKKALPSKLPIKKQYNVEDSKKQEKQLNIKKVQKIDPITAIQQNQDSKFTIDSIPKIASSRHSSKQNGLIYSYAANTHNGNIRNYNEDRVSIILNISRPDCKKQITNWPECSFFAVYDGHGGSKCADLLRDQLHQIIVRDENFPENPKKAIVKSIYKFEKMFVEMNISQKQQQIDRSGSCIILALIVDQKCYIGNVGDSRALRVSNNGKQIDNLSFDHKPEHIIEQTRIVENGGQIYKSYIKQITQSGPQIIYGPLRVFPGRLSVSRTIGDIEAKLLKYGGNSGCVICKPDVKVIDIQDKDDFLFLGCDGIFEKMDNKDVINSILKCKIQQKDYHIYGKDCIDSMMKEVLMSKSMDNLTVVLITFKNFNDQFNQNVLQNHDFFQCPMNFDEKEYEHEKDDSICDIHEKDLALLLNQQKQIDYSQSNQILNHNSDTINHKLIKK